MCNLNEKYLSEYNLEIFGKVSAIIEEPNNSSINKTNNIKIEKEKKKITIALLEKIAIKYIEIAAIRNINFKRYIAPGFIDQ